MVLNAKTRHRAISKILESKEESDGSVWTLEDDPDKESEEGTDFLDLTKFPVPAELSEEEGGGEQGVRRGARRGARWEASIQRNIRCSSSSEEG